MKYYAVKKGRTPGIYTTWKEAENQVKGFSGASYKSFQNIKEANEFLTQNSTPDEDIKHTKFSAYVDGSFDINTNRYSSGIVILDENKVIEELSFIGNNKVFLESNQVAGEVLGVLKVLEWAKNHEVNELTIHYDYQGIESWITKEWRANKPISVYYINEFNNLSKDIKVQFVKVKAHSGDKYNDLADTLAKNAFSYMKEENSFQQNSFEEIDGAKTKLYTNINLNNILISHDEIYSIIKTKILNENYSLSKIKKMKTIINFDEENITLQVEMQDEKIVYFEIEKGELLDGKK